MGGYFMKTILKKGDIVKTALSDSTVVLKVEGNKALLFDGASKFVKAYGVQKDGDKVFWNQGYYYNEIDEVDMDIFKKHNKKSIENEEDLELEL